VDEVSYGTTTSPPTSPTRGYSTSSNPMPTSRPTSCAITKPGTGDGAIPANVSVKARPIVTAGLANDVEDVNQYAAPDVGTHRGRRDGGVTGPGQREDQQYQSGGRDDLAQRRVAGGNLTRRLPQFRA
jgi:hypothetical protein